MVPIRFVGDGGERTPFNVALSSLPKAAELANIYFPTVNANPADGGKTFLGLFPTTVECPACRGDLEDKFDKRPERGAILLSVSVDGVHFAPPLPLVWAFPNGGEINDHSVDGLVRVGDTVYFYVHHGVPGTLVHLCPRFQPKEKPPSTIVRYALNVDALAKYTEDAVALLSDLAPDDTFLVNASGIF